MWWGHCELVELESYSLFLHLFSVVLQGHLLSERMIEGVRNELLHECVPMLTNAVSLVTRLLLDWSMYCMTNTNNSNDFSRMPL